MKTTDEQREKIILGIADMLRNHGFTFEFKVMKKPREPASTLPTLPQPILSIPLNPVSQERHWYSNKRYG